MVDFSSGYVPPGVFVEGDSTGSFASVGIGDTVVCLVGAGIGYQTNTENVSFASVNSVALTKKFIDPASIVVTAVLDTGKTTFLPDAGSTNHDYGLTEVSDVTTVVRHTTGTIPVDRPVTITYHYADDTYFDLNKFSDTDFNTFNSVYGSPIDPVTGDIQSPLSFAAQLAFRNGARTIYAIAPDVRDTTKSAQEQFAAAYAKTLGNYEINLIVPIWTAVQSQSSAISYISDLSGHLQSADSAQLPRMALCGVGQNYSTTDIDSVAQSVQYKRIVLLWPQAFTYFNSVLNGTAVADGFYFAAAVSGVMVAQSVNRGLTHSSINSFTGLAPGSSHFSESQKNTWASRGVAVAEINRTGALIVRHGITTDTSSTGTMEISIVRCQDAIFESIALTLIGAELIGDPITVDTPTDIKSLVQGALESAVSDNIIQKYTDINASQGSLPGGSPTVISVTFSYFPTYPLNYITVTFTLDLTTGNLQATTTTPDNSGAVATT